MEFKVNWKQSIVLILAGWMLTSCGESETTVDEQPEVSQPSQPTSTQYPTNPNNTSSYPTTQATYNENVEVTCTERYFSIALPDTDPAEGQHIDLRKSLGCNTGEALPYQSQGLTCHSPRSPYGAPGTTRDALYRIYQRATFADQYKMDVSCENVFYEVQYWYPGHYWYVGDMTLEGHLTCCSYDSAFQTALQNHKASKNGAPFYVKDRTSGTWKTFY